MNEMLLGYFNLVEKHHWWWEGRRQILRQEIDKKEKPKILDIGCGTGETITFLENYLAEPELCGVDNSPVAVRFAKERGHKMVANADACRLPFASSNFDYILLLDTIEHIEDDTVILKEAKRVLKKDGKIIITAPALELIWSNHDSEQGHFRRYTRRRFRRLADKTDLEINKLSYFNFILSPIIITIRLLSKLKPLSKLGYFDSNINFNLANVGFVNQLLRFVFICEIKLMKYINYPWGISLCCALVKR